METISFYVLAKTCIMLTFLIICAVIAWIDIQKQKIYNEAVAALFVPAIVSFFVFPEMSPGSRLLGALSVSGIMLFICLIRPGAFGGGDIKLMMPVGLYLGLERTLAAGCLAVCIGVIWGLAAAFKRQKRFPFGPSLCLGAAIALLLYHA